MFPPASGQGLDGRCFCCVLGSNLGATKDSLLRGADTRSIGRGSKFLRRNGVEFGEGRQLRYRARHFIMVQNFEVRHQ
ncbi:hypothetical protein TNCV_610291 [Trichonephila clavipes]|nr:hypothetical protein TNCV_610291 [Trichonephila clavipes]